MMLLGMWLALKLGLVVTLLSGLLVFQLTHVLASTVEGRLPPGRARAIAVIVLSAIIISALVLAGIGVASFFRNETGGPDALLARLMDILNSSRHQVPALLQPYIPEDMPALRAALNDWAAEHQRQLGVAGTSVVQVGVRVLIGMVLGAMIALYDELPLPTMGPLAQELIGRTSRLATAFRQVVFAQVKISCSTPFHRRLPAGRAAVVRRAPAPFQDAGADHLHRRPAAGGGQHHLQHDHQHRRVVGLVLCGRGRAVVPDRDPQAGVLPQCAHRRWRIQARAWELLLAMLVMEAAFGLPGLVAAPVFYAYVKRELVDQRWI